MEKLNNLIEIAEFLEIDDVIAELHYIKNRLSLDNDELILPIVGEFSSGKTTLINKLTDGKKLETASKPTTSFIYEIYFSCEEEKTEVIFENNLVKVLQDDHYIKNDDLKNVKHFKIYDRSEKIPRNTILVDTPGISSNNPKHLEALSNYLPNADALLLFSDANQQITTSLLDFIETNDLLHLPLYIVITKADTKTQTEINDIKKYISKNVNLKVDNIISISSQNNDLVEFNQLMDKIQDDKNRIVNEALNYRLDKTKEYLKNYIQDLLKNLDLDSNIEEEIKKQKRKYDRTLNAIDDLILDIGNDIDQIEYDAIRQFENHISSKLNSLISNKSENIDNEAIATINSTANLIFSKYQDEIRRKLYAQASERKSTKIEIPLRSIESVDFSDINIGQLSYGMNLSAAGNRTVKNISTGIKITAVIAAVAVTAGASIKSNRNLSIKKSAKSKKKSKNIKEKILEKSKKAKEYFEDSQKKIRTYEHYNNEAGKMINHDQKSGFVEKVVGFSADSVIGKPARTRMINKFLRESLNPEFKNKLKIISEGLLKDIQGSLKEEATIIINQSKEQLTELYEKRKNDKEEFDVYKKKLEQHLEKLT